MRKKQIAVFLILVLIVGVIPQNIVQVKAVSRSTSTEGVNLIKEFE